MIAWIVQTLWWQIFTFTRKCCVAFVGPLLFGLNCVNRPVPIFVWVLIITDVVVIKIGAYILGCLYVWVLVISSIVICTKSRTSCEGTCGGLI